MYIPRSKIAPWATEIVRQCTSDLEGRIQQGALFRNLYLTGDENGSPSTYPKTFEYIEALASIYFSPLELSYLVKFHGGGNPTQRAMGRATAGEMHEYMTDAGVYEGIQDCVKWSLVKGKTLLKMNWEDGGFAPYVVQPEFFGVLRPDITDLDRQPAFVHVTYYTPAEFQAAFRNIPNLGKIMKDVAKRGTVGGGDRPDRANALKQIVLGGLNPYQQAGNSPAQSSNRGLVNWLGGPQANWDPQILATLIRLDELWVKDSITDDWVTFQMVGDVLVSGETVLRNNFADMFDPNNAMRRLPDAFRTHNPLSYKHPFVQFSGATKLNGYFWGRSEMCNIAVLQMQINARLNGIARLLRRQENPPKLYLGGTGISQQKYSTLDKPGGFFTDSSPNAKMTNVYPELPQGLWESLHETERMFDEMGGRPPVLKGRGESGVRSHGHAETLTSNASPRFKNNALAFERSVKDVGALALAMLRAMEDRTVVAWLKPGTQSMVAQMEPDDPTLEPPTKGMRQYPFKFYQLPENVKVTVESHSSSPIFLAEYRSLVFDLVKIGAMTPAEAVEALNPPNGADLVQAIEEREVEKAAFLKEHPEALKALQGGKRSHH